MTDTSDLQASKWLADCSQVLHVMLACKQAARIEGMFCHVVQDSILLFLFCAQSETRVHLEMTPRCTVHTCIVPALSCIFCFSVENVPALSCMFCFSVKFQRQVVLIIITVTSVGLLTAHAPPSLERIQAGQSVHNVGIDCHILPHISSRRRAGTRLHAGFTHAQQQLARNILVI